MADFSRPEVGEVILVPPPMRKLFLDTDKEHIRVQSDDNSSWIRPAPFNADYLFSYIKEGHDAKRFWIPTTGLRVGYDDRGVYIHQEHVRRYFGVLREFASVVLKKEVQEVLPLAKGAHDRKGAGSTEKQLGHLLDGIGRISEDVRQEVLRAAFRGVDKDRNGVLGKDEMVCLVRRVLPTMSGKQVVQMMDEADTNKNKVVDYEEFVTWLQHKASPEFKDRFAGEMGTEIDCVRAVFRLWDKNGDGLITKRELTTVLKQTCPEMTSSQVDILSLHLDRNKDGQIDYDEFLSFLFGT